MNKKIMLGLLAFLLVAPTGLFAAKKSDQSKDPKMAAQNAKKKEFRKSMKKEKKAYRKQLKAQNLSKEEQKNKMQEFKAQQKMKRQEFKKTL